MDYNLKTFGEHFQVLCLYLAKIIEKFIMVYTPCENSLDIFPAGVPGAQYFHSFLRSDKTTFHGRKPQNNSFLRQRNTKEVIINQN